MIALLLLACGSSPTEATTAPPVAAQDPQRVVVIGPAAAQVAEQLALPSVVAVDSASATIPAFAELPDVGFSRRLTAEGILSVGPDLVLVAGHAGPESALDQLRAAGVSVVTVPHDKSVDGIATLAEETARALGKDGAAMVSEFRDSCDALDQPDPAPTALFVYARGGGTLNVSGTGTAAAAMLDLAGVSNAVEDYEGYRPFSAEAAVAADPDYVLFTTDGLAALGGIESMAADPGLGLLTAVREGRVVAIDDLDLLALGVESCRAASALAKRVAP